MMQDTIQNRGGNDDIGKRLIPLGKGLCEGENGRYFLVPPGNELVVVGVVGREPMLRSLPAPGQRQDE